MGDSENAPGASGASDRRPPVDGFFDHAALDRDRILPRLVARRAREDPDRPFVVVVDGPMLTYRQVHEDGLRWAGALRGIGVAPERTVATMLPISPASVTTWLGISWLRAWEAALNTDYRGAMLTHALVSSGAETLIIDERFLDRLREIATDLPGLRRVIVTGTGEVPELPFGSDVEVLTDTALLSRSVAVEELEGPEPWDISTIVFTSGTTGPSKGVMMPWAQLLANFQNPLWERFGPDDHRYSPFPMFHISGKGSVYGAALDGAQVVLRERWSLTDFWSDIARYRCTFTWLVGAIPSLLYGQPETPNDADTPLRYGAMTPMIEQYRDFERRFGMRVCTVYNMSEMSMPVIADWDVPNHRTCGRARPGYQVRLVDEHGLPVGPGEFGEFVVRSDTPWTMNVGYLGMPAQTAAAWRHGWFHTGDGGTCDEEGNFYFVDRIKHAIRRRGENISSMEVEREVLAHPDVAECAAIGVPSALGEEDVMVFVVPAPAASVEPEGLSDFLDLRMPRFMRPRYVQVIDELPKTVTARVRKAELRALVDIGGATWDRETPARVSAANS